MFIRIHSGHHGCQEWILVPKNWSVDMLHPAPVSTSQSNLWTCALGYVTNHSGMMCFCHPAYWGCSLALSSCGGTLLPTILFVRMGCVVSYMAIVAMFLLLPVPLAHGLSLASAFFCIFCSTHFLLLFLWAAAFLEVSLLPTIVTLSISSWALLLWVWRYCSTAVAGPVCTLTSVSYRWSFPIVFHLHDVLFTYTWVLNCSGSYGGGTKTLHYA